LGVTRNKVHRDIQRLRRDWQELSVASYEKKAAYVLENYSYVAKQAKVAFEASIGKVEKRKARKPTAAEMKAELRSRERLVVLGLVEPKLTLEQVYLLGQVRVAALAQEIMELSDMNRPFARGSGGSTS